MNIPSNFNGSAAFQLIQSQGWNWEVKDSTEVLIKKCFQCGKEDHCYMEIHGNESEQKQRDGLWMCQHCSKSGNLYALKSHLGLIVPGVSSQKEWGSDKKSDPLPDVEACHTALLADGQALDYLQNIRGFSLEIIKKQKLGVKQHFFRETGEVKALVIPYLLNDNCIWAKYRTLPDPDDLKKIPKAFASPKGWDAVLYNLEALAGVTDIVLVEGECDCIAALDKGVTNICGVPGANIKKAEWIQKLDTLEKVYILYDNDKVGQKAAQDLACRIGIEKCWKVTLPNFMVTTDEGVERKGKDINEWFMHGGTAELFQELLASAVLFDVDGVAGSSAAIDEFTEELEGKGAGQKYIWPLIQNLVQFDEGDIIDILAPEKIGKTTFGLNLLEYMVDTYGEDGLILCTEMTRARLARKWVCHKSGIADNLPKTPEEAVFLTNQFKQAIPVVKQLITDRKGDLYFCYPKYQTMDDIYKLLVDCIRRYGVKWIMVDNLQRLCDTTIGNHNRTQWLSEISKKLSQIAKDYNVQMVRILQPHRIADNKLATSDSVDGASQVAKDCDVMIILNRNRVGEVTKDAFAQGGFIETDGSFGPELLVSAGLSRYSAGGATTLYYDGATSTIHKLTEGKIAAMNAKANPNVGYEKQAAAMNLPLMLQQAVSEPVNEPDVDIKI
jgi:twinkle protein